jgi:hypothetical protein
MLLSYLVSQLNTVIFNPCFATDRCEKVKSDPAHLGICITRDFPPPSTPVPHKVNRPEYSPAVPDFKLQKENPYLKLFRSRPFCFTTPLSARQQRFSVPSTRNYVALASTQVQPTNANAIWNLGNLVTVKPTHVTSLAKVKSSARK